MIKYDSVYHLLFFRCNKTTQKCSWEKKGFYFVFGYLNYRLYHSGEGMDTFRKDMGPRAGSWIITHKKQRNRISNMETLWKSQSLPQWCISSRKGLLLKFLLPSSTFPQVRTRISRTSYFEEHYCWTCHIQSVYFLLWRDSGRGIPKAQWTIRKYYYLASKRPIRIPVKAKQK